MTTDNSYWINPIGAPTDCEVAKYLELIEPGTIMLLGCTQKLLPLCDVALDLEPLFEDPKIKKMNWLENSDFYQTIIGDGVLNLGRELCHSIVEMASRHSAQLIVRSFNYKLAGMRYACYFPKAGDFEIRPKKTLIFDEYSFFIWRFS